MNELRFNQLKKVYKSRVIFENLSCAVTAGQCFVVTGPNGSGKSTLLKLLCGLLRPSAGTVELELDGTIVKSEEKRNFLGYVSPEVNLYHRLTAVENLSFFAAVRGITLDKAQIKELLAYVQLIEAADQLFGHFSSGMKQRLKLAVALLHNPPVLMLDEPTSNLDNKGKGLIEEIVEERKASSIIIIATNEPEEVEKYGQKVLRLDPVLKCPN